MPDGTLLFHLALIIVMVAVLNATLLKPINRILEERERHTKGRLTEAQIVMANVERKLREYERRLREARSEGYALMERERNALAGESERKLAEVKAEISRQTWRGTGKLLRSETEQGESCAREGRSDMAHRDQQPDSRSTEVRDSEFSMSRQG